MQGLYIHIPFCKQACLYCDFHFSTLLKNKTALIEALCKEIGLRHSYLEKKELDTIYFGGGTPSLLNLSELRTILETVSEHFAFNENTEITLECNPDDLSKEKLTELRHAGINRLSIGLQSFDDAELKWMNRAHNAQESETCVKLAQDAGFENITIDLIYGSKFQTLNSWKHTLAKAVSLNVPHISSYNLTVEEKTALGNAVNKGLELHIDDEKSAQEFLLMIDLLESNGYEHYEISNFAKKGFESKHNSNYWKGAHYLGIGPSAHSFNGVSRQWNVANNNIYIRAINNNEPYSDTEVLTTQNKFNEYILTGLRTKWGCDLNYIIEKFGENQAQQFTTKIQNYIPELIVNESSIYRLTKKGKLLADKIAMELFL